MGKYLQMPRNFVDCSVDAKVLIIFLLASGSTPDEESDVIAFRLKLFALSIIGSALSVDALAAAAARAPEEGYHYPELLVVPKASQTLAKAAAEEKQSPYTNHLLLAVPATLTLSAGLGSSGMKDKESKTASMIASGVGAGWVGVSLFMSAMYTPYSSGLKEVQAMPSSNAEQMLAKERKAEQVLSYPAYLMRRMQYLSAFTNFAAGAAVASLEEKNDSARLLGVMAASAAFLPLIFDHTWISTYDQQEDYKKRIYGPLVSMALLTDSRNGQLVPGVGFNLSW